MFRKLLALVFCLAFSNLLLGDVIIQFGRNGNIGLTGPINVTAGSQLTLDIYATQSGLTSIPGFGNIGDYRLSSGDPSRGLGSYIFEVAALNSVTGLAQTEIRADKASYTYRSGFADVFSESSYQTQPNGTNTPNPTSVLKVSGVAPDDPTNADPSFVLPRYVTAPFTFTPLANNGPVADNSIHLGTLTFNIDAAANGVYTLELSSPNSLSRPTLGTEVFTFFNANYGNATLNVSAVPEPTSVVLFSVICCSVGVRRFRRSRTK